MYPPGVELMYDYVDPASFTGQNGIEMKLNEVYITNQSECNYNYIAANIILFV